MSNYLIQSESLVNIATAIRSKSGTVGAIQLEDMPQRIRDIGQIPINPVDPTGINVYIVTDDQTEGTVEIVSGE